MDARSPERGRGRTLGAKVETDAQEPAPGWEWRTFWKRLRG